MITIARLAGITIGVFLGVVLHSYATAKMSDLLGDRSPRLHHRLTLNPKAHADPIGTLAVPGVFLFLSLIGQPIQMIFAWGKPIPNNFRALRNQKRDQVLIGLAGPAMNLALAAASGLTVSIGANSLPVTIGNALIYIMSVNVFILIINIFPLPPLAGARVLMPFLSGRTQLAMQEYSKYLILLLVVLFFLRVSLGVNIVGPMTSPLCRAFVSGLTVCPL